MVELRTSGNIFESDAEAIVNPVNCVGVMGAGLALAFKKRYPMMFRAYAGACKCGQIQIGRMWLWYDPGVEQYIINFPTKQHWKEPSQLIWISDGLDDLKNNEILREMESVALPALGCGYGGLEFKDVRTLIEDKLGDSKTTYFLFEPR